MKHRLLMNLLLTVVLATPLHGFPRHADVATLVGRSWTATEEFRVPGHDGVLPDIVSTDSNGTPFAVTWLRGGPLGRNSGRIDWRDSTWVLRYKLDQPTNYIRSMPGTDRLGFVWNPPNGFSLPGGGSRQWVITAQEVGDSVVVDTVSHMWAGHFSYGGAMSARRRWVAFQDNPPSMKLFYSDTAGIWRPIAVPGDGSNGIAMWAVDDTTAMLAWGETRSPLGIRWGVVRGAVFVEGERPLTPEEQAWLPEWLPRPSGGWWLAWTTNRNHIGIAHIEGLAIAARDSVFAEYEPPGIYYTNGVVELSDVGRDHPMVGWSAYREGSYQQVYCLSVPLESDFGLGQQTGTPTNAYLPHFTVDGNGDTWVAWYTESFDGMYFRHTYPHATSSMPSVSGTSASRTIRWTLSEPAPESWWAVLRSADGSAFEQVGRAQATEASTLMQFEDATPSGRVLRYRVRRECMDKRYEWLSPIRFWNEKKPGITLLAGSALVNAEQVEFAVSDAAPGPITIKLFDVQGRVVWRVRAESREKKITLRFSDAPNPIRSGLYFAIVEDSLNQPSIPVKVVIVR